MNQKINDNSQNIPGKTLQQLKEEAKKIEEKVEKDKKIFQKYFNKNSTERLGLTR